ncbi:zinc finger, CCHC-type containing protein [Tanacetum coccineum]
MEFLGGQIYSVDAISKEVPVRLSIDKFKVFKNEVELQQGSLIKRFRIDRGGEYMDTLYFQSVGIIHETTAPYTPQQNGISKRKNRVLKEMVNSMLSYSVLSQGFLGEAMAIVSLPNPKLKTLGERGIECIFVGYAEHSKTFRFSSVPRPSLGIPNGTEDIGGSVVPKEATEEDDPKTFDEAMKSQDVIFWKETINDELDSIIGNNTWVLADLPPSFKPFGCKWIFKRKLKVDGTVEKFKARLVIQGFKQNKFDESGKGVIICLYVDDMLIFGTDQVQVDLTKKFLSSRFSMKDMGEADVILGIRIKHESNGIAISQSRYIKKVLKKFNYFDCTPVSTLMDTCEKLMPNNGHAVSQL